MLCYCTNARRLRCLGARDLRRHRRHRRRAVPHHDDRRPPLRARRRPRRLLRAVYRGPGRRGGPARRRAPPPRRAHRCGPRLPRPRPRRLQDRLRCSAEALRPERRRPLRAPLARDACSRRCARRLRPRPRRASNLLRAREARPRRPDQGRRTFSKRTTLISSRSICIAVSCRQQTVVAWSVCIRRLRPAHDVGKRARPRAKE